MRKSAFDDFASLDCLYGNPHSLDLPAGKFDPYALQVRLEFSFVDLHKLQANAAGFLADSLVYDPTADSGPLSSYCANSRHGKNEGKDSKWTIVARMTSENHSLSFDDKIERVAPDDRFRR